MLLKSAVYIELGVLKLLGCGDDEHKLSGVIEVYLPCRDVGVEVCRAVRRTIRSPAPKGGGIAWVAVVVAVAVTVGVVERLCATVYLMAVAFSLVVDIA